MNKKINLLIFGATGSIGNSVFSIIRKNRQKFNVQGVTCNKNVNKLILLQKQTTNNSKFERLLSE